MPAPAAGAPTGLIERASLSNNNSGKFPETAVLIKQLSKNPR
jgi:hypothetical protein